MSGHVLLNLLYDLGENYKNARLAKLFIAFSQ